MTEKQKSDFYKNVHCAMIDADVKECEIIATLNKEREKLGKKAVSQQCVNAMIRGIKDPTMELINVLISELGVTYEDLVRVR